MAPILESVERQWGKVRHSVRSILRKPLYSAAVILTVAIGVGANTSILSVVYQVLVRPLPFPAADRLVLITEQEQASGLGGYASFGYYSFLRSQKGLFEDVGALDLVSNDFTLTGIEEPQHLVGARATASFLPVLGVQALLGRMYTPEEDRPGSAVALLSESLWRQRFGARTDVIGQSIRLNAQPYTLIGVLPDSLRFLPRQSEGYFGYDIWIPLAAPASAANNFGGRYLQVIGRLNRSASLSEAQRQLQASYHSIAEGSRMMAGWQPVVEALHDNVVGNPKDPSDRRPILLALQGTASLLLLIACVNVTSLMLVRWMTERKQIAIRMAVGARLGDLASLVLAETGLLFLVGGAVGHLWPRPAATAVAASLVVPPQPVEIGGQAHAFLWAFLLSFGTALLCGLTVILATRRLDMNAALREGNAGSGGGAEAAGLQFWWVRNWRWQ